MLKLQCPGNEIRELIVTRRIGSCVPLHSESVLVRATLAPGTTTFAGSVTVPTMLLVITTWASGK